MDLGAAALTSPPPPMTASPRSLQTPPNLDNMTLPADSNHLNGTTMVSGNSPKQSHAGNPMGSPGSSLGRSASVSPPGPALSLVTKTSYAGHLQVNGGSAHQSLTARTCGQGVLNAASHPLHHPPLGYHHHHHHHRGLSQASSPPGLPAADLATNDCRLIEYRGAKVAAFLVQGDFLLCLPQAFELFLKHLVGGLHTVYTKLKRLDITPVVCNVEQVRILRGLGAIQPGVNRCKLLSCKDFDALYKDCTTARRCFSAGRELPHHELAASAAVYGPIENSRPGRPPKRVSLVGLSSTGALVKKTRLEDYHGYENGHITGDSRLDKTHGLTNGYASSTSHALTTLPFMALSSGHPSSASSVAMTTTHAHLTARTVDINRGSDVITASSRLRDDRVEGSDVKDRLYYDVNRTKESYMNGTSGGGGPSPVLNLSQNSTRGGGGGGNSGAGVGNSGEQTSDGGFNDNADDDDYTDDDDEEDRDQDFSDHPDVSSTANGAERIAPSQLFPFGHLTVIDNGQGSPTSGHQMVSSIETLLRNIQGLLKVAADNARQQERQINIEKAELKMEVLRERELRETLEKQLIEEQRTRILYQKRLKKEKRQRRRYQEQLEAEVKKRAQFEEALHRSAAAPPCTADTLRMLNDSLTQELERERNAEMQNENKPQECPMSV